MLDSSRWQFRFLQAEPEVCHAAFVIFVDYVVNGFMPESNPLPSITLFGVNAISKQRLQVLLGPGDRNFTVEQVEEDVLFVGGIMGQTRHHQLPTMVPIPLYVPIALFPVAFVRGLL